MPLTRTLLVVFNGCLMGKELDAANNTNNLTGELATLTFHLEDADVLLRLQRIVH